MMHSFALLIAIALLPIVVSSSVTSAQGSSTYQTLPDLSGIAWIGNNSFLAVHDAKFPEEASAPRASLLTLPSEHGGTVVTPLNVTWPNGENPGSDLECVARIPGPVQSPETSRFLLGESGDNDRGSKRIFLAELNNNTLLVNDTVAWPIEIHNVEGCEVAAIGDELVFIFAERAQGSPTTDINWGSLLLDPLSFGPVKSIEFRAPVEEAGVDPGFRPVSAIEVDQDGNLFISSAFDPDIDEGPFWSQVWLAGHIASDQALGPQISLLDPPEQVASIDGFKVEGLTTRPAANDSGTEVIIGTDDEFHGGVLRVLHKAGIGNTTSLSNQ